MADSDLRRQAREAITLVVDYEGADDMVGDYTTNLSEGGTFIHTDRDMNAGDVVRLVLSFPGLLQPMTITGVVRHVRTDEDGMRGAGVEFVDGAERAALSLFVERLRKRDPDLVARVVRVLVVEDNPHVARLVIQGLASGSQRIFGAGVAMHFDSASNGSLALDKLRAERFDALIIDVYLPVLDGPGVIAQVRKDPALASMPIIAVSAGGPSAKEAALGAGADHFLDKPMRLREIVDTMRKVMDV